MWERRDAYIVPPGSRFKGYQPFLVQDLVISARATCYQRECWITPDGRTILAPLPEGIDSHFGPELRRFVLMQYHQGRTEPAPAKACPCEGGGRGLPRLAVFLRSVGGSISRRQLYPDSAKIRENPLPTGSEAILLAP
jgi:hypothetical protein